MQMAVAVDRQLFSRASKAIRECVVGAHEPADVVDRLAREDRWRRLDRDMHDVSWPSETGAATRADTPTPCVAH
jgi:hypothetical protein